ncbi:hypothetical protein DDE18_19000 [Nocardioides gansuensis]|uniref:Uncharacterized protein n=1 Tax=Nocardioides gansuensis TaxID=2138300 RepID=A0A2T8F691_9ACTN|nr:hypothetical protein [Nocardioides gansuensis]PVG81236.1 hypothetical protein DDE18_19000 [Nocardioides gansuensis]
MRSLSITSAAALLLATTAIPASAARLDTTDPAGDVWKIIDANAAESRPTDHVVNVDVTGVWIKHGARRVVVKASFAELTLNDDTVTFWIDVKSDRRLERSVQVWSSPEAEDGDAKVLDETGSETGCVGLTHVIDRDLDRITVTVPARCLGRPTWLRHKAWASALTDRGWFIDPAGTGGSEQAAWSARIRRG